VAGDAAVQLRLVGQRQYADLEHPMPVFELAD
jgi:hypothetical protein